MAKIKLTHILFIVICWLMTGVFMCCVDKAMAHGTHLNDYSTGKPAIEVEPGSFNGTTLKGTDGKCYVVYIDQEKIVNSHRQLHIREVSCEDMPGSNS